jgi:hypothetical protein
MQAPPLQVIPRAHGLPQTPQFALSLMVSTQAPLHGDWFGGHAQRPPLQLAPTAQTFPQPPQLRVSLAKSAQTPPQSDGQMH